jgi:hypothetical protein
MVAGDGDGVATATCGDAVAVALATGGLKVATWRRGTVYVRHKRADHCTHLPTTPASVVVHYTHIGSWGIQLHVGVGGQRPGWTPTSAAPPALSRRWASHHGLAALALVPMG